MDWDLGSGLTDEHRERFRSRGVDAQRLDGLEWRQATGPWPPWWDDLGNVLYLAPGARLPDSVIAQLVTFPFRGALLAVGGPMDHLSSLLVGGDDATVFVDSSCVLTAGEIYCGGGSHIVLHGPVVGTRCAVLDARNGGGIVVEPDQLWAANVYIATDDMHRLEDRATGQRLNPYGASIRIGRHVWLCRDAVVTGHAEIGEGACVAMRSVVRGQKVPAHVVAAGVPARIVRENIAWDYHDRP